MGATQNELGANANWHLDINANWHLDIIDRSAMAKLRQNCPTWDEHENGVDGDAGHNSSEETESQSNRWSAPARLRGPIDPGVAMPLTDPALCQITAGLCPVFISSSC
jgi:hypothetical protein